MIYAISTKHKVPEGALSIDVTSRSKTWGRYFSPFNLGPVNLYDGYVAKNIENGYQFAKLYAEYVTVEGLPAPHYWEWAKEGWANPKPIKYPLGPWSHPLCHWWDGKKLSKLEAQNQIFLPLYKQAVLKTTAYEKLNWFYHNSTKDIFLIDFESYDHRFLEQSWDQVVNNSDRPVGQAFALCMLLEGYL